MPLLLGNVVVDEMLHETFIDEMIARSLEIEYTEEELVQMEAEYARNIGYDSNFGE